MLAGSSTWSTCTTVSTGKVEAGYSFMGYELGKVPVSAIFGALGAGYVVYGRKQHALPPFLSGVALIVFPYLVTGGLMTLLLGAAIAVVPYFWRT